MVQIVEQTHEEKLAMYMKLSKKELVEMLISCNDFIRMQKPTVAYVCEHDLAWQVDHLSFAGGFFYCRKCGFNPYHTGTSVASYYVS